MASVIDSLVVLLNLDASKFDKGSQQARDSFKKTKEEFTKHGKDIDDAGAKVADAIGKVAREALAMFAVFVGASSLKQFVSELATADSALGRLAANLGSTPQTISAWGLAVERIGGNAQAAMGSLQSLSDKLQGLRILGKQLPQELYVLQARGGQTIDVNRGAEQAILDIAQNLQNVAKREGRPTAAWLGRSIGLDADTVNVILEKGPALRAELERMKGLTANDKDIQAAQKLQEAWAGLQQSATDLGRKLVTELSPALKEIFKNISEWIDTNKEDIKKPFVEFGEYLRGDGGRDIKQFFKDLASVVKEIAKSIKDVADYAKMIPDAYNAAGEAGLSARNWLNRQLGLPEIKEAGVTIQSETLPKKKSPGSSGGGAEPPPSAPLSSISSSGGLDRKRFAAELAANPALREKVMAISAGENLDPKSNLAVIESMMNRASMMGTPLAKEGRTTGEGGYYAGYNPSALNRAKTREMIEANLETALKGSNVSNYATDNASQAWGWRRMHNGFYQMDSTYGNEYFGHPVASNARGANRYQAWRAAAARQEAETGGAPLQRAGSLAAFSGLTPGARLGAGGSSTSSVSNSSSELNIHGPISVYTQAQDADQMARDLRPALQRYNLAAPANDGAN